MFACYEIRLSRVSSYKVCILCIWSPCLQPAKLNRSCENYIKRALALNKVTEQIKRNMSSTNHTLRLPF